MEAGKTSPEFQGQNESEYGQSLQDTGAWAFGFHLQHLPKSHYHLVLKTRVLWGA
jgi:hypothetical protein